MALSALSIPVFSQSVGITIAAVGVGVALWVGTLLVAVPHPAKNEISKTDTAARLVFLYTMHLMLSCLG